MEPRVVTARTQAVQGINKKWMYYITLTSDEGEEYHINVGEKTFRACAKMEIRTVPTEPIMGKTEPEELNTLVTPSQKREKQ